MKEKDAATQTGAKRTAEEDFLQVELEVMLKHVFVLTKYLCTGCNSGQQVPSRLLLVPGVGRHLLHQAVGGAGQGGEEKRGEQYAERQEPPQHPGDAKAGRHPKA